ncbi:MAG TPA: potassium-transporting ATPase subunit KdpB, partial [Chloroflexia bacterium]|nr:potassium-transporting ATPase subunit KdpB [Chloroflexia bacterium]
DLQKIVVNGLIIGFLWLTVVFANFAEALAEGRGKAQAATLRKTKVGAQAKRLQDAQRRKYEVLAAAALHKGDLVLVEAGDLIPSDGEVIQGVAYVNEAAITGESAPVIKEPGTDISSSVTGGTTIISDSLVIRISAEPGHTFLDRMIALVEGAARQKTPNEIALNILLVGLTVIFLIVVVALGPFAAYSNTVVSVIILVALLVTLIPTTIGALLSAIGIAGMDRLVQRNVLAMSGRAVEAAGDIDVLLLDKTGTITFGNRMASEFIPVQGHGLDELAQAALLASVADDTPEGKSIVALAERMGYTAPPEWRGPTVELVPFTAETRVSGAGLGAVRIIKGAVDSVLRLAQATPPDLQEIADFVAGEGGTPLAVAHNGAVLGIIYLKDTVKPGIRERFAELRQIGIRTIMITGDNPLTAATIAREAGVDDFVAQAKPEDKIRIIREQQAQGRLVAMTGDGTNDAPALAQADVAVAMNSGTAAAKEAGNMVDLDSDPTKLLDIVYIGKQLLMTRGALTTFSIANDVAKYFAIIPAAFAVTYPELGTLNIMGLNTGTAILSAIIFNALIIVALIPLSLRGVAYQAVPAADILRRNILIYGVGGIIAPFIGIKLIDILVNLIGLGS